MVFSDRHVLENEVLFTFTEETAMYFEYLGIDNALSAIGVSMSVQTMVGPFPTDKERTAFLEQCHAAVSQGKTNPNRIKFICHDQLPVTKVDKNEFQLGSDGELVPALPLQWGAVPPDKFLEILQKH